MSTKSEGEGEPNIPLIKREHEAVLKASGDALQHAIACGEMLRAAKAGKKHGKYLEWLAESVPEIPERTAQTYMRLAKNADAIEKAAAENRNGAADLSVRGALRLLSKPKEPLTKEEREAKKIETAQRENERIADAVEHEVSVRLRDPENAKRFFEKYLFDVPPSKLVGDLWAAKGSEYMERLSEEIDERLNAPEGAGDPLDIPPELARSTGGLVRRV